MVDGKTHYTESTHLKASANKGKFVKVQVQKSTQSYLNDLDESVEDDRRTHGIRPLKEREQKIEEKSIKASTTEPDSGYMVREGKPKGFFSPEPRTADGKYNIITDR